MSRAIRRIWSRVTRFKRGFAIAYPSAVSLALKNIDAAVVLIDDLVNVTDVAEITLLLTPELAT